ncbi:MAG TPA: TetR/AcrR family transcriptional regulator [Candidatus Sulfomarinibacteraceae bacterium]|nr:TetR/AcrR family transcriptional regulator [Candidatus Sulfomarinibacteraceae bacterium]
MNKNIPLPNAFPPSESGRAGRRDAAANRVRILETAERLFAERGVPQVSMADVAQEARVGKGTLYRNFANKGELCLSLMDTQLQAFQDEQLSRMRAMSRQEVPYLQQLGQFLEALVAFTERHMPLLYAVQQHSDALDEAEVQRPHFWQHMTVHGLLRQAVAAGELPDDLDVPYTTEALLAPLSPQTFRFQREILGFDLERIAGGLRQLLVGLGRLAPSEDSG